MNKFFLKGVAALLCIATVFGCVACSGDDPEPDVPTDEGGDDSFEWFGGTVNARHLIAYKGWDDEFDTDYGYSGKLQFLLGVRDPKVADTSKSNGFESDNDANGSGNEPLTNPIFSNVTLIGPFYGESAG